MSKLFLRIEELCKERGITITELCRESGASRGSLSDLKQGRKQSLSAETLSKIATYFEVSVDYLLGNEPKEKPTSGESDILNEIDIAFYGDYKALDDEQKEIIRDMARTMRRRREEREGE